MLAVLWAACNDGRKLTSGLVHFDLILSAISCVEPSRSTPPLLYRGGEKGSDQGLRCPPNPTPGHPVTPSTPTDPPPHHHPLKEAPDQTLSYLPLALV